MTENELLADLPAWLKYMGGAAGFIIAAVLALRQWLSSAGVSRAADAATQDIINTLQEQLTAERIRADELMREREAMAQEIGQLRGEVSALRSQVAEQGEQIRKLVEVARNIRREVRA